MLGNKIEKQLRINPFPRSIHILADLKCYQILVQSVPVSTSLLHESNRMLSNEDLKKKNLGTTSINDKGRQ